jgi:hypothetical protein
MADATATTSSGDSSSANDKSAPQKSLNEFWDGLIAKNPTKIFRIFPRTLYENLLPPIKATGASSQKNATESYNAAAEECRERVKRIVRECHRTNEKFTDPDFDLEKDYLSNCLNSLSTDTGTETTEPSSSNYVESNSLTDALSTLVRSNILGADSYLNMNVSALTDALERAGPSSSTTNDSGLRPAVAHRIDWIFEDPSFIVDGISTSDVMQGAAGDCWFVAAVSTMCSKPELMEKVCVARDAECGVYGFVFYRDGEWISTVVDDNLYLTYV